MIWAAQSRALRVIIASAIVACGTESHERDDRDPCNEPVVSCDTPDAVDLLFVIQNGSNIMDYQNILAGAIRELLEPILSRDIDLQLGVIGTELAAPVPPTVGCVAERADDGVLRTRGAAIPTCDEFSPFARFSSGSLDLTAATDESFCRLWLGGGGCLIQQSLEAMLKALATASSGITFAGGTLGHGDRENAGFLRPGSVLAVVFLMTRDDCSAADPSAAFDPAASPCGDWCCDETLYPVSRYVEGLRQIRAEIPGRIVIAPIVGVPWDLPPEPPTDFESILMDPLMAEDVFWCAGSAIHPARRMVRFAQAFGACGYVQPVCRFNHRTPAPEPVLRSIGEVIADRACATPMR